MKRIVGLVVCILIIFSFSGCSAVDAVLDAVYGERAVAEAEAIPKIAFSSGVVFENNEEVLFMAEEFSQRTAETESYAVGVFYNTLSEEEKTLYHAYEYAMEKGYTNILVDDLLISDKATLEKILKYLALDSPLLEQNLRYESGDFTMYYDVGIAGIYKCEAELGGYYISVKNFGEELFVKKLEALEKAKEIIATIPEGASPAEKAEELYSYVAKNITYYDYGGDTEEPQNYLYDALVTGKTHCDGYTNAISLLFNMSGIPCVEKMDIAVENEVGHTWNSFSLDEVWYNCDATAASTADDDKNKLYKKYYFGFEDRLQESTVEFADIYTPCSKSFYIPVDAHIATADTNRFYNEAKTAFASHNKQWALIVLDTYDQKKVDNQLQKLVNYFWKDIYYYEYELIEGRTAVLICANDYMG